MTEEKKRLKIISDEEETVTITLKKTQIYAYLIPVVFIIGLVTGYFLWGREGSEVAEVVAQQEPPQVPPSQVEAPQDVQRYEIEIYEDDPRLGAEDAPVTIIEFSDFECPFCRRHNLEVFDNIIETYGEQIRYIYKDLPLTSIHPNALPAAAAALCAHEQGEFWAFHDKLFSMELGLEKDAYMQYAENLELDMDTFTECVEGEKYNDRVRADLDFATSFGVGSTPTFFINGVPVIGAQPFNVFAQVIDSELEKAEGY